MIVESRFTVDLSTWDSIILRDSYELHVIIDIGKYEKEKRIDLLECIFYDKKKRRKIINKYKIRFRNRMLNDGFYIMW